MHICLSHVTSSLSLPFSPSLSLPISLPPSLSISPSLSLYLSLPLSLSLLPSPSFSLHQRDRLDSSDSRVLDGDLLDDVLTAPSSLPRINKQRSHTPTNDDEVCYYKYIIRYYIGMCVRVCVCVCVCMHTCVATSRMNFGRWPRFVLLLPSLSLSLPPPPLSLPLSLSPYLSLSLSPVARRCQDGR